MNGRNTSLILFGFLLLIGGPVRGQGSGGTNGGGSQGGNSQPDPIAIVAAHILKGQTNNEQRKAIRLEWLTIAAQQAEDLLRTSAFKRIVEFVDKNHKLFESIYAGLRTVNGAVASGKRVQSVASLQRRLVLRFADTGRLLVDTEYFTPDELRHFTGTLDKVMKDTEANFRLLVRLFWNPNTTTGAQFTDMERMELLETIEARLESNLQAINQLNRYVTYLNTNRAVQLDGGMEGMFTLPE